MAYGAAAPTRLASRLRLDLLAPWHRPPWSMARAGAGGVAVRPPVVSCRAALACLSRTEPRAKQQTPNRNSLCPPNGPNLYEPGLLGQCGQQQSVSPRAGGIAAASERVSAGAARNPAIITPAG